MASKEMSKSKTMQIVQSIVLIVLGVLIAVANVNTIVDYIIGAVITVLGIFILVDSVYQSKSFINASSIIGGVLIGLGVATLCSYTSLGAVFQAVIEIGVCCIGILLIVEAIMWYVQKKGNKTATIYLIIGIVAFVLGILLITIAEVREYALIIAGVLIAVIGVINLIVTLVKASK